MEMAALPSRADSPSRIQELTARVKHKYHKMPGLILTQAQAQRLFGLDGMTFEACVWGAQVSAASSTGEVRLSFTRGGRR